MLQHIQFFDDGTRRNLIGSLGDELLYVCAPDVPQTSRSEDGTQLILNDSLSTFQTPRAETRLLMLKIARQNGGEAILCGRRVTFGSLLIYPSLFGCD
jgi:hypothetical protein